MDVQEQVETPRSMVRRNRSSKQILNQVTGKYSNSEGATRAIDDVVGSKINPGGDSSRSTFLTKREC